MGERRARGGLHHGAAGVGSVASVAAAVDAAFDASVVRFSSSSSSSSASFASPASPSPTPSEAPASASARALRLRRGGTIHVIAWRVV